MKRLLKIPSRLSQKFTGQPKRKKALLIATGFIVVLLIAVLSLWITGSFEASRDKEVEQKFSELNNKENVTCQDIIESVGNIPQSEVKDPGNKAKLLNRQMSCFSNLGMYDDAIRVGEELKALYESRGNSADAEYTNDSIEDLKQTKIESQEAEKTDEASQ